MHLRKIRLEHIGTTHTHNTGSFTRTAYDDRLHRHPYNKISLTAKSETLFWTQEYMRPDEKQAERKTLSFKTSTDEPTQSTQTFGPQTASNSLICHARQEIFHAKEKKNEDRKRY